jgi:hypothetical protein
MGITASDLGEYNYFGWSVSINGDHAVVGSIHDPHLNQGGPSIGSVHLYTRLSGTWTQTDKQKINAPGSDDYFGGAVAVSQSHSIVEAATEDHEGMSESGASYIYAIGTGVGPAPSIETAFKITASDAAEDDWFGKSVSIDGDYAIVGSDGDDDGGSNSGSAYIFKRDGTFWSEQDKFTTSDGSAYDAFGQSVSINGQYAIVGAPYDDDGGTDSGSAYIFKRDGATWSEQDKLTASDGSANDHFGFSVATDGKNVIVGSANQVLIAEDSGAPLAKKTEAQSTGSSGSAYVYRIQTKLGSAPPTAWRKTSRQCRKRSSLARTTPIPSIAALSSASLCHNMPR